MRKKGKRGGRQYQVGTRERNREREPRRDVRDIGIKREEERRRKEKTGRRKYVRK